MSIFDYTAMSYEGLENITSSEFKLPTSTKESRKSKERETSKFNVVLNKKSD